MEAMKNKHVSKYSFSFNSLMKVIETSHVTQLQTQNKLLIE